MEYIYKRKSDIIAHIKHGAIVEKIKEKVIGGTNCIAVIPKGTAFYQLVAPEDLTPVVEKTGKTFGATLKQLRGKRTQQEIANLVGVARASYSHYETEHVQPTLRVLKRLAEIYGVTVDVLLEGVE